MPTIWQTLSTTVVDKALVWLANVDNTADADKPVSTATQTALNWKEATLWNPTNDWDVLSSTIAGVRSWITPSAGGWTWLTLYDWTVAWPQVVWKVFEILTAWAWTITKFKITLWIRPAWTTFQVTLSKNWVILSTATIASATSLINGLAVYTWNLNTAFVENDNLSVDVIAVWSTTPWSDLTWSIS